MTQRMIEMINFQKSRPTSSQFHGMSSIVDLHEPHGNYFAVKREEN